MTEIGRAAVTGGAGFVGSTLVDQLLAGGTEVLVVDDLSHGTTSNLDSALATGARLVELDIRDAGQLERELAGFRPDVVFHLAVVGGGPVGVTALALLGHAGLRAVGMERESTAWPDPRAVHFDGETMRSSCAASTRTCAAPAG
jgi:saccharopine dehydrogenase-like NADP-dependent oxidoreductase